MLLLILHLNGHHVGRLDSLVEDRGLLRAGDLWLLTAEVAGAAGLRRADFLIAADAEVSVVFLALAAGGRWVLFLRPLFDIFLEAGHGDLD